MSSLTGRATLALALSASAMSLVSVWFAPFNPVWPGVGWAVVGCVGGLWAIQVMASPTRPIRDVIAGVEAELPAAVPALVRRARS